MAAIEEARKKIDDVDARITELLNERARAVEIIGREKQRLEMKVYEPGREEKVLENVRAHNCGPLSNDALKRIYERVMDEMRTLQRDMMRSSGDGNS